MTHISEKSFHLLFSILILCLFLAGCGKQQEDSIDNSQETIEFYDITTEKKYFPEPNLTNGRLYFMGMQFYREEPVQLWGRLTKDFMSAELFLLKIDGTEEIISTEIPAEYFYSFMEMYLDRNGNLYCHSKRIHNSSLGDFIILNSSGKELYSTRRDDENYTSISYIHQVNDDSIYYIYYDTEGAQILGKSQPGSPPTALMSIDSLETSEYFGYVSQLGGTEDQVCVCMAEGFWQLNPEEETRSEILMLKNTSYSLLKGEIGYDSELQQDFRVLEDGSVETLWCFYRGDGAYYEKLTLEKVSKIPLVIRGKIFDLWIRNRIGEFNHINNTYHIVLDEFFHEGDITPSFDSDFEDYSRLTNIQLAAGKGPDLLYGEDLLGDSAYTIMEKGIFQDLRPYMEADGIQEEDYFPNTFCRRYSEKIYGILPSASLDIYRTDQELLDGKDLTNIETLLDALLNREESAVYLNKVDSVGLLRLFLESSDDLWNMLDWETGSCNFNTELFTKLLEAAKRYGYDEKKQDPILALSMPFFMIYDYALAYENRNTVNSGILYEDGCHAILSSASVISINANSQHTEGAWEFIKFLLGEESQSAARGFQTPMLKSAFEEWVRKDLKKVEGDFRYTLPVWELQDGKRVNVLRDFSAADFPESKIQAYRDTMENARLLPLRIDPLLDIICEEAISYFNGDKSIPEVTELIQNRVQLYLNEHK